MSEKVKLPREVAEAIGRYLEEFDKPALIEAKCDYEGEWSSGYTALDKIDLWTLATALVNGYEVERTPEERMREYYYEKAAEKLDAGSTETEIAHAHGQSLGVDTAIHILCEKYPELIGVLDKPRKHTGIECPKCGDELIYTTWEDSGEYGYSCVNCGYELREGGDQ